MDIDAVYEIFQDNPGEAIHLAKRMGVSRQLVSMLLKGKNKGTGILGDRVRRELFKRAAELGRAKGSGKPRRN